MGALEDDGNGSRSKSVHVFNQAGDKWTHKVKLLALDRATDDQFGNSVAIFKNTVVVGAHQW